MKIRPVMLAAAATAGLAGIVPTIVDARQENRPTQTYVITVENLTPAGSQPLSPVGTVVHGTKVDVWSLGSPASAAVAGIAEDAAVPLFVDTYSRTAGVIDASIGGARPIPPGQTATFEVEARRGDRLSLVSMLVNTNDAFTGLDSIRLGNQTQEFEVGAYDAGTELNNELADFIPGPAGNSPGVRDPEGSVITMHEGILGGGDLDPSVYGWDDPVARITVEQG